MTQEETIALIKDFFAKLDVHVIDVEIVKQGDIIVYNVRTNDSGRAIGKRGEHIDAYHHLLSLIIKQKTKSEAKFNIDINGYKQDEMNQLIAEVRKTVEEVVKTKKTIELRPMNSYERLLIHNMFGDDIRIETSSIGEGKERRVVIKYSQI